MCVIVEALCTIVRADVLPGSCLSLHVSFISDFFVRMWYVHEYHPIIQLSNIFC